MDTNMTVCVCVSVIHVKLVDPQQIKTEIRTSKKQTSGGSMKYHLVKSKWPGTISPELWIE